MNQLLTRLKTLSPDALLLAWLGVWFGVNLIQGAFTELNNDEAYYHIYAQHLAWGYFDHPPFIGLLIWLGEMLCGVTEIGLRLFVILLQPLYIYLFWRTIKPESATRSDVTLYLMIFASIILMQPYGFIAVPDAPLMFSVALFLWAYKRFLARESFSWWWLAISMAAMAYSKYQGALVVIFAIALNYRLLFNWRFWLSGIVALVLFLPHLLWQYQHDFPSFIYHLSERNRDFNWKSITEFVLNLVAVFNPLFIPLWVQAYRKVKATNLFERALKWIPIAIFVFFLFSSVRGRTQPQWMIASTYGLVWILFSYAKDRVRTRRYIVRVGGVILIIIALLRLELIFNISGLSQKHGMAGNKEHYAAIYDIAGERPVIFGGSYAIASKYIFYTPAQGYCTPSLRYRTHQWQYVDDNGFAGQEALVEYTPTADEMEAEPHKYHTLALPNGSTFRYYVLDKYTPQKDVRITTTPPLPATLKRGESIDVTLQMENPYPQDIAVDGEGVRLLMIFRDTKHHVQYLELPYEVNIMGGGALLRRFTITIPDILTVGEYQVGFSLIGSQMNGWFSAPPQKIKIE